MNPGYLYDSRGGVDVMDADRPADLTIGDAISIAIGQIFVDFISFGFPRPEPVLPLGSYRGDAILYR